MRPRKSLTRNQQTPKQMDDEPNFNNWCDRLLLVISIAGVGLAIEIIIASFKWTL